jgi:hypothetical protein
LLLSRLFQILEQPLNTATSPPAFKYPAFDPIPIPYSWTTAAEKPIGSLVVVAPQGADLVLASHVPHGEGQVLVLNGLHIESDGWNGGDNFTLLDPMVEMVVW